MEFQFQPNSRNAHSRSGETLAGVITNSTTIVLAMRLPTYLTPGIALFCMLVSYPICSGSDKRPGIPSAPLAEPFPDISGLAWVEGDSFLAVHDAKNPEENNRPRVSLLELPKSLDGITWKHLTVDWPLPLGPSSDLESIARIPGTNAFLLVESGEGRIDRPRFLRAFLIEIRNNRAELLSYTELPQLVKNIEGSAVARVGSSFIFLCAERGDGRPSTEMYWTDVQLRPLKFGSFKRAYFKPVGFTGQNKRPVSAIEVDNKGRIYIASAYDPEDDNGPFSSVIWRAGHLQANRNNTVNLVFLSKPYKLATLDGLKVESLAVRETKEGVIELFAGTDDENYGGALRAIPMQN